MSDVVKLVATLVTIVAGSVTIAATLFRARSSSRLRTTIANDLELLEKSKGTDAHVSLVELVNHEAEELRTRVIDKPRLTPWAFFVVIGTIALGLGAMLYLVGLAGDQISVWEPSKRLDLVPRVLVLSTVFGGMVSLMIGLTIAWARWISRQVGVLHPLRVLHDFHANWQSKKMLARTGTGQEPRTDGSD